MIELVPFLRIALLAAAAFVIVGFLPLPVRMLLVSAIIFTSAWRHALAVAGKLARLQDPTGYAIRMGALMAATVDLAGTAVEVVYNLAITRGEMTPGRASYTDPWTLVAMGSGFVWSLLLGALGGLIGGLQFSKTGPTASWPAANARWIWIAVAAAVVTVLVIAAILLYIITLARGMSDGPG